MPTQTITNKNKTHYSYHFYYTIVFFLVSAGIITTSYLTLIHYKNYTDIGYASFCAISKTVNCDTVSQSPWSLFLNLPVALWGFIGYLFYLFLLIPAYKNSQERLPLWAMLQVLGLLYSLIAVTLGYISAKIIHSYCLMCLISYGISFLLFLFPLMIRKRFDKESSLSNLKKFISLFFKNTFLKISVFFLLTLLVFVKLLLPHYWVYKYPISSSNITTGFAENASPWIGAQIPQITIEEFSDYQCFQCSKLHSFLRRLIEQHPTKIRLVHHHYPLDHNYNPILLKKPFHVGSGKMALLAIYASSKGQFWKMNDELYNIARIENQDILDLRTLAKKVELPFDELQSALVSNDFRVKLALDIQKGLQLGITGTPAYLINGKVYQGSIPADVLQNIIQ